MKFLFSLIFSLISVNALACSMTPAGASLNEVNAVTKAIDAEMTANAASGSFDLSMSSIQSIVKSSNKTYTVKFKNVDSKVSFSQNYEIKWSDDIDDGIACASPKASKK